MRTIWNVASVGLFLVGGASLALTLYLWFGTWPQEMKEIVDHERSVAANTGRAPDPLIQNVRSRDYVSLSGTWKALIDPYERGGLLGSAPRAMEPRTPSDLGELSFENGLTLEVPGDWNTQDPRLVFYQGVVWYKRTFEWLASPGTRSFLWFGAANYRAAVYLNGTLLGEHRGGFTPFNFEVTDALREGENLLVVRVDNRHAPEDIPTPTTDWLNHGGLTRDVLLVSVPDEFARAFEIRLDDGGERIVGWVQLDGPDGSREVRVRIPELGAEVGVRTDETGRATFALLGSPERWSPELPHRYRVAVEAGADRVTDEVGFRTVAVRGREILLNGEPVFLRGISLHEERLDGGGRPHNDEQVRAVLALARELGCNFVRLAHYPHSDYAARVADELGLLVWSEIPVYWNVAFDDPGTLTLAKQQLSEMIERDRNRASIVLWSIANETPQSEARFTFLSALAGHVRAEDPSRLVTAAVLSGREALTPFVLRAYLPALLGFSRAEWRFDVNDPLEEVLDVVALNEYLGWYYSGALAAVTPFSSHHARRVMLDNLPRIRIRTGTAKPLVVSELGAGALAGLHAEEDALHAYSEEYQALVYRQQLAMLERQEGVAGISPWILKDFRSPLRLYQGVQDYWNRKGLVSDRGERKQAFEVLRAYYEEKARGLSRERRS